MGLLFGISAGPIFAEKTQMVERHIFTPETAVEQKEEVPAATGPTISALEKELQFTGVLVTPKGKRAIIAEAAKNDKAKPNRVLKEGDQIKGMIITEIGPNYVLLAGKENAVRLNLYKGAKPRPVPQQEPVNLAASPSAGNAPNTPKPPDASANAPQPEALKDDTKSGTPNEAPTASEAAASPFGGGARSSRSNQENPDSGGAVGANPFAEILRRGQGNAPSGSIPLNLPKAN